MMKNVAALRRQFPQVKSRIWWARSFFLKWVNVQAMAVQLPQVKSRIWWARSVFLKQVNVQAMVVSRILRSTSFYPGIFLCLNSSNPLHNLFHTVCYLCFTITFWSSLFFLFCGVCTNTFFGHLFPSISKYIQTISSVLLLLSL